MSDSLQTTRRGVLWLGLKCDVRCKFCYDELVPSSQKMWVPLDDVKQALNKFRQYYQNEYVDFMGGEPTLHPQVVEIVRHSSAIGLQPTLITHGMRLADEAFLDALIEAGVHDFLISIHGLNEVAHEIHRRGTNNSLKQQHALENLAARRVPFRFNVTVIRDNLNQLADIARLAVSSGAGVVNFLTFNPYFEWTSESEIEFQVSHGEASPKLMTAIDILTGGGVEANVRYMPLCTMPGYEAHIFTGHQLPFDIHEWDYNSWYDQQHPGVPNRNWYREASSRQQQRHGYVHVAACSDCSAREICDGVQKQYLSRFGESEFRPISGDLISEPDHFIAHQQPLSAEHSSAGPPVDWNLQGPLATTQFREELENRAGVRVTLGSTRR